MFRVAFRSGHQAGVVAVSLRGLTEQHLLLTLGHLLRRGLLLLRGWKWEWVLLSLLTGLPLHKGPSKKNTMVAHTRRCWMSPRRWRISSSRRPFSSSRRRDQRSFLWLSAATMKCPQYFFCTAPHHTAIVLFRDEDELEQGGPKEPDVASQSQQGLPL